MHRMVKRVILGLLVLMLFATTVEGWHRLRFGHFVGPGLHTDVLVENSDIGSRDMYVARIWNLSLQTLDIEGCRLPGGFAGSGVLYHWDVQRWAPSRNDWGSLHGADNWLPQPLG